MGELERESRMGFGHREATMQRDEIKNAKARLLSIKVYDKVYDSDYTHIRTLVNHAAVLEARLQEVSDTALTGSASSSEDILNIDDECQIGPHVCTIVSTPESVYGVYELEATIDGKVRYFELKLKPDLA